MPYYQVPLFRYGYDHIGSPLRHHLLAHGESRSDARTWIEAMQYGLDEGHCEDEPRELHEVPYLEPWRPLRF